MRLVQVPAERAVDERLRPERAQRDRQRPRRKRRDEPLQRERTAERRAVALVERRVALQGVVAVTSAREDLRDLAPRGDAEVERRADALAGQREAVPGAVAGEEHAVLGRGPQPVREPVALVADRLGVQSRGQRDRRLLDVAARVVGADADARLTAGRYAPAVAAPYEVALDPDVEGVPLAALVRVWMHLEPATQRGAGRLVVRAREDAAPAERVHHERGVQGPAVRPDGGVDRAMGRGETLHLGGLEARRAALRPEAGAQGAVVERRPAPRQAVADGAVRRREGHRRQLAPD